MADQKTPQANAAPVGYCHPPVRSRFQKGRSGNPAGRPKGGKNAVPPKSERLRSLMLEEAYRPIKVGEDGEEIALPVAQAVFRALADAAAKGEARAQAMFLKLVSASEREEGAIEEMFAKASEEVAAPDPVQIVYKIVDPANPGR